MLVGNKLDMEGSRKTSRELGETFAKEEGLLFMEASAKSGDGVEELFLEIGKYPSHAPYLHVHHFSWTLVAMPIPASSIQITVNLINNPVLWVKMLIIDSEEVTASTPSSGQAGGK